MMPFQKVFVSPVRLEIIFRKDRLYKRMLEGEFTARVIDEHPADPSYGQPEGTLSQMVAYYNTNGAKVCLVHQYLRPDGRLGGRSKRPSPKNIRVGDTLYVASTKRISN